MSNSYIKRLRKAKIKEAKKISKISSGEACKIVACSLAVQYFETIALEHFMDDEKIIEVIKDLEKRCWRKNLYPQPKSIVSLAIFLVEKKLFFWQISRILGYDERFDQGPAGNLVRSLMQKMKMINWNQYDKPIYVGNGYIKKEGYWDSSELGRKRYWAAREREQNES